MKKLLLFFLVVFLAMVVWPKPVSAAACSGSGFRCVYPDIGCDPGGETYRSDLQCQTDDNGITYSCCQSTGTTQTCAAAGGICRNTCISGEDVSGSRDCPGSSPTCCVPKASPTCDANGQTGIDTAIGCIPITDTNLLIGFILRWAIGIGGGIAFLLIVYAAFMIMTSQGNPERLKAGQELLTSAIAGLIMLIFSVFILRVIGVDILGLPGFGSR